ncbi:glycoside hydrolase domain-containing protein [Streptacidiphilus albus]|uniref:glycoside hydrolase domain-containing protein n=1 Tax=Streptacidiphilus albus TaxID=105425 RepID=UPI000691E8B0|nr:glycoside hydrolase domain-containing protein [Streptacidiphilus albus]
MYCLGKDRTAHNCTASVVKNPGKNLILTAGHCMHAKGYLAGFYSSADSGITQLSAAAQAGAENLPDELWSARWVCDTSRIITSTWDPVLPDALWSARNRSRQYLGEHTVAFGGIPLDVDTSYWDAPVAIVD